jgi:hypothetical protein
MLRLTLAALAALALAACNAAAPGPDSGDKAGAPVSGYTMIVRADQDAQVYLVADEQGRVAAARATKDGASQVLEQREARALLAAPVALADAPANDAKVDLHVPGFSLSVRARDDEHKDDDSGDHAQVSLNLAGHGVDVDAIDNGGESGRANVRITGADEKAVHDFIADADGLSDAVRAEMLDILGLD